MSTTDDLEFDEPFVPEMMGTTAKSGRQVLFVPMAICAIVEGDDGNATLVLPTMAIPLAETFGGFVAALEKEANKPRGALGGRRPRG